MQRKVESDELKGENLWNVGSGEDDEEVITKEDEENALKSFYEFGGLGGAVELQDQEDEEEDGEW